MPHVNAVSKTATTSPATTSDTAKEATVTSTTPMLERGTVNGTHNTDLAGCMTQPPHGPLTYRTIAEDDTEEPGNTEISVTAMPRSPTTPETVETAIDTSREQQAMSQPQERTMTGFTRQSSTVWHTTSIVQSSPVTPPPQSPPLPQQQRLPGEQMATPVQKSTSENRQQTAEQPVTTTLQHSQVETEDQCQSADPRETTDHTDSGQEKSTTPNR